MEAKIVCGTGFEEEFLYNLPPATFQIEATSDKRHSFSLARTDDRVRFFWDAQPGEPFDELIPTRADQLFLWSPNRDRVAYWGHRKPGFFVGIDDVESEAYVGISRSVPPTFSGDGKRVAYGALTDPNIAYLVVDSVMRTDQAIAPVPALFSPDGTRLAYAGERLAPRPAQWIVVDDAKGPECMIWTAPGALAFSPNSRRFAYVAVLGKKSRMILDGKESPDYDYVGLPTFSPDSARFCYIVKDGGRMWLVVDDAAEPKHDGVHEPTFSADSRRLAYGAVDGKSYRIVLDGAPGPEFGELHTGWRFSDDSVHFAYHGQRRGGGFLGGGRKPWITIRDGTPNSAEFDAVASFPHFSPDGAHLAYAAGRGKDWFAVVDDTTSRPYRGLTPPQYSASGRLTYVAQEGEKEWHVVVDGEPGPAVESVSNFDKGSVFFSPDGHHFAAVVLVGGQERPMVDHELGPSYLGMLRPTLEEGRVVLMAARGQRFYRVTRQLT